MIKTAATPDYDPDLLNVPSMTDRFVVSCSQGTKPPIRHTYSTGKCAILSAFGSTDLILVCRS